MNIGEASATTTILEHLTKASDAEECPDDVVLAVVELNGRARRALGAGPVLPIAWTMRRDEILEARRNAPHSRRARSEDARRSTSSPSGTQR